jgi:pyridoxal phosphate enzyme (YggS family)
MDLADNLNTIHRRITAACDRAGRDPDEVTLLAVTKGHSPATVQAAAELGLTLVGENRVQEAKLKIGQCPGHLRWHMIGHLQSNKVRDAVRFFEMIQSVDSLDLAREIDKWAERMAKTMPVLLEVNVAGESTKFGYHPDKVLAELEELNTLRRIELRGLMAMAPWTPQPEKARPVFRRLRELKQACDEKLGAPLDQLSMGMSGDFEIAIEEGATLIRLGTALFGSRQSNTTKKCK